jgi:hypothetical protein
MFALWEVDIEVSGSFAKVGYKLYTENGMPFYGTWEKLEKELIPAIKRSGKNLCISPVYESIDGEQVPL